MRLVDVGVDTNVFNASGTGRLSPDFTATLQPHIDTVVKTPGLALQVTTVADFVYYAKYASERAINPRIDVTGEQRLSTPLSLYGEIHVGFSKARTGLEIDSRPRQLGLSGIGGARLRGRKLEFDLHGGYARTAYAQNAYFDNVRLADTLDRTTTAVNASVLYRLTPYTSVTLGDSQAFTRFRSSPDRNVDTNRPFIGLQFNTRALVAGSAEFGYLVARPANPLSPRFQGFAPSIALSSHLGDTTTFGVGATRNLDFSYDPARPYFVYVTYDGSVRQAIAHRFDVGLAAEYSALSYRTFLGASTTAPGEHVRSLMGTVGVPIRKDVRVDFYAGTWQRLSVERPYTTLRAGAQVTVGKVNFSGRGMFVSGLGR